MKMAGVVSQGICFPLSILPPGHYEVDQDVTEILNIKQYSSTMDIEREEEIKKAIAAKYPKWLMRFKFFRQWVYKKNHREGKGFPQFVSKTDETRIQNIPAILQNKNPWVVTEKVDGQSGTFCLVKKKSIWPFGKEKFEFIVCSRNLRLYKKDNSSQWRIAEKYNLPDKLERMRADFEWIAIQGECVAPNVQGNKYKVNDADLYVFNVIYPTGRLDSVQAADICKLIGLKFVPIIDTQYILPDTVNEVLDYATGQSQLHNTLREGFVFRSQDGKQSFKAVSPTFLLKHDE